MGCVDDEKFLLLRCITSVWSNGLGVKLGINRSRV